MTIRCATVPFMMSTNRQPSAAEVDEFMGQAIAELLELRPELLDELTGQLCDDECVAPIVRRQVVELAERQLATS